MIMRLIIRKIPIMTMIATISILVTTVLITIVIIVILWSSLLSIRQFCLLRDNHPKLNAIVWSSSLTKRKTMPSL